MHFLKKTYQLLFFLLIVLVFSSCGTKKGMEDRPNISQYSVSESPRITINDSLFFKDENSLRKNEYGQWEMIASGNPLDLGNIIGVLSQELIVVESPLNCMS